MSSPKKAPDSSGIGVTARSVIALVSILVVAFAVKLGIDNRAATQCRSIPGDEAWPTREDWRLLNQTVDGKLVATIPIAAVCHHSASTDDIGEHSTFDQEACDALRSEWFWPKTHLASASSAMAYQFTNDSCNPFLDPDAPCGLGYLPAYTVNATTPADLQAAVNFAQRHNIRLVIRNTGHDYLGKSTGAHSLAVWTLHMKDMSLIPEYQHPGSSYQGPAIKLGAGVEGLEAYTFANSHGLMVVGGNCPNVGITGGFTQGGGISILSSKFGLAADQVLSWEVVTAAGELVTADPTENADLFWALRGGGGGTFGIVVSMTVKAFPDTFFSSAHLTLPNDGTNTDAIYSAISTFFQSLPSLVDAGAWVVWVAAPFGFMVMPAMAAGLHPSELDALFQPTLSKMDDLGLAYTYASTENPDFLSAYRAIPGFFNASDYHAGGRLIPRSLVADEASTASLVAAVRAIGAQAFAVGVAVNVSRSVSAPGEVAANPYFRRALMNLSVGVPVNYTDWAANRRAQDRITNELLPRVRAITPGGAAYLNEADFQEPDWRGAFYGEHYARLVEVKRRWDGGELFWARTAVGSERWEERGDGRLCRT